MVDEKKLRFYGTTFPLWDFSPGATMPGLKSSSNDLRLSLLGHFRSRFRPLGEIPDSKSHAVLDAKSIVNCKVVDNSEQFFLQICQFQDMLDNSDEEF